MADEPKIGSQLIAAVNSASTPKMLAVSDDSPPRLLVTTSRNAGASALQVEGPAADGAAVVGNPVRIAGKDGGGLTQDILTETDGILRVALYSSDSTALARIPGTGDGNTGQGLQVGSYGLVYNGTNWDRARSGSATSTDPHFGSAKVVGSGGAITLQASVTKGANFSGTAKTGLGGFRDLVVTLDITSAERDSGNETYDFYITTGDGVSSWDIVHFPQIATTGAKRYTATVSGRILPQEVTTATPGVAANVSGTLKTDTAGAGEGIQTLAAGKVRHGPWGDRINHELVVAGTIATGIVYSITITPK